MRPAILFPLFADVTSLPGVGPKLGKSFARLGCTRLIDVLWRAPYGLLDRRMAAGAPALRSGAIATLALRVDEHVAPPNPRRPYRVYCSDAEGQLVVLVYFHPKADWLAQSLPPGHTVIVSGKADYYGGEWQITHPDYILPLARRAELPEFEPVYALTEGLGQKQMGKAAQAALQKLPDLPEWLDPELVRREGWPGWRPALASLHGPNSEQDVALDAPHRRRLAYDELLANQLALALVRRAAPAKKIQPLTGDGRLRAVLVAALPYQLTRAQQAALADIDADLAGPAPMVRLLQGDVGSGKTIVAFLALLTAVEAGRQGAFLAPTEILARQHFEGLQPFAQAAGVRLALLTGRDKGAAREKIRAAVAAGEVDILIGTHAIIQDGVDFRDLALAVIDEQHKFGVHQRLALAAKGSSSGQGGPIDILVMTATPIPRTLCLTAYGDMEVSALREKPPGRQPIETRALAVSRLPELVDAMARAVAGGARVYWICPLIEESETLDLAAAEARFATLQARFGARVGLAHGRMKGPERDAVMAAFASGAIDILVATTVVEVGVNVPEATVMVIEAAERFGLAQLHQLRGRVGRGAGKSFCLLLHADAIGATAKARLKTLRDTDDGFVIAEQDLKLRGAGEVLGARQSGMPEFHLADLAAHDDLLSIARDDSRLLLTRDPRLQSARGQAVRNLLYLFERDAAADYLKGG